MKKKYDYLIIGQGLAGTFFAFQLLQQKKSFLLMDSGIENSSSSVAAGVINPIVLKRLTLSWRAQEFLTYNLHFYKTLEQILEKKYFFPMHIDKLISSNEEVNFWKHRYEKANLSAYLERELKEDSHHLNAEKTFKIGRTKQTAWLNIGTLLKDFRSYLVENKLLLEETFAFEKLRQNGDYGSYHFDKFVFCEGAAAVKNPLFKELPFRLNKGQLLTIQTSELPQKSILKKSVFILPIEKETFKVGASYAWQWKHEKEDEDKTVWLKEQLSSMTDCTYKIEKVEAGIRPAVKDRRPLMGQSPIHKKAYILNGMGSRGCLMAPLLANELYQHIEYNTPLNKEANINRFKKS